MRKETRAREGGDSVRKIQTCPRVGFAAAVDKETRHRRGLQEMARNRHIQG